MINRKEVVELWLDGQLTSYQFVHSIKQSKLLAAAIKEGYDRNV